MKNYYDGYMKDDYDHLIALLEQGNVVVCYVDYIYDTGEKKTVYRDVAKAKVTEKYPIGSPNHGFVVEARGIRYIDWNKRKQELRHVTFQEEGAKLRLQYIEIC